MVGPLIQNGGLHKQICLRDPAAHLYLSLPTKTKWNAPQQQQIHAATPPLRYGGENLSYQDCIHTNSDIKLFRGLKDYLPINCDSELFYRIFCPLTVLSNCLDEYVATTNRHIKTVWKDSISSAQFNSFSEF